MSSLAAYTSDINLVRSFIGEDCVTNALVAPSEDCTITPSLLLAAAKMEKFRSELEQAKEEAASLSIDQGSAALVADICDRFAVKVGVKMLAVLPPDCRIAAEVDVALSHDTEASIAKASHILCQYEHHGIGRDCVLVKLALSWESIQACKALEGLGINCSMALLQHQHYKQDGLRLQAFIHKVFKLSTTPTAGQETSPQATLVQQALEKQAKLTPNAASLGFNMKMLQRSGSFHSVLSTECPTSPEAREDTDSTLDDMSPVDTTSEDAKTIDGSNSPRTSEASCEAQCNEVLELTQHDLDHLRSFASRSMTPVESDGASNISFAVEQCPNSPSLLLAAVKMPNFRPDLKRAAREAKEIASGCDEAALVAEICDRFAMKVGARLLQVLPEQECLALEIDPNLCFDTEASVAKASKILKLYAAHGIQKDRIIVRLAPSWESIQARNLLEAKNVHCNMTLVQNAAYEKDAKQLRVFIKKALKL